MGAGDEQLDGDGGLCEDGGVSVRRVSVVLFEEKEAGAASADAHRREAFRMSGSISIRLLTGGRGDVSQNLCDSQSQFQTQV